jgi:hypothetical protein
MSDLKTISTLYVGCGNANRQFGRYYFARTSEILKGDAIGTKIRAIHQVAITFCISAKKLIAVHEHNEHINRLRNY